MMNDSSSTKRSMTRAPGVEVLVIVRDARTGKVISGSEVGSGVCSVARSVVSGGLSRSEIENVNFNLCESTHQ
jgi:hypothetical protein